MRKPCYDYAPGPTLELARCMSEAVNLLNALAGLAECFDEEGVFHYKDGMIARCEDARTTIKRALPDGFKYMLHEQTTET